MMNSQSPSALKELRTTLEALKRSQLGTLRRRQSAEVVAAVEASLQGFIESLVDRPASHLAGIDSGVQRNREMDCLRRLFDLEAVEQRGAPDS